MAGATRLQRVWPILSGPISSLVSIGLRDQNSRFLPGLIVGDRWFVIGEEGRRYSLVAGTKVTCAWKPCSRSMAWTRLTVARPR